MAQLKYSLTFDLGSQLDITAIVNKQVFPLLNQAVKAVAQQTAANWQESVHKAKLWSGEKDAYAASIKWSMTGDFTAMVESDYKYAEEIENGRPARDLKKMLDTSQKVRQTEDGRRFLVIPFRHNTPGNNAHSRAMPKAVHDLAKGMAPSRVTSMGERPSGQVTHLSPKTGMSPSGKPTQFLSNPRTKQHAMVASRGYDWGGRLTASSMKAAGIDLATRKRYAGMVKMDTSTPGGAKSSAYMTFRVMMEGSSGWIVPAQPGQQIAKKVVDDMGPKAQLAFSEAISRTLGKK